MTANLKISKATWLSSLAILLIGLVCIWFWKNYTRIPYEIDLGFSTQAKRNPFLALEYFAQKNEINFNSRKDFKLFDQQISNEDIIFINNSRVSMSQITQKVMREWVENGGHLVLLATENYDYDRGESRDKFLDELGVRLYRDDDFHQESTDELLTKVKFEDYQQQTEINFFDVYFMGKKYLQDSSGNAYYVGGNQLSDHILQYELGYGYVTVLSNFSIWDNSRIDKYDHAMFFLQLVADVGNVWFVYNRNQPSFLSLIIDKTPYVIISLSLLLLLLLFSRLWRQGVVSADLQPMQREIMQHISAAADFNYRLDHGKNIITSITESLFKKIDNNIHGFSAKDKSSQLKKLAEFSEKSPKELQLLWQQENQNHEEFITKVKLIQNLRKQL